MTRHTVNIPARIISGLRRHAVAAGPIECCGALIGTVHGNLIDVRTLIPVENTATVPSHEYRISADVVLRIERQAASAGLQVVGFYHSHPGATAVPSASDVELAFPGYVYLLVQSDPAAVRAWRIRDDRSSFTELDITPYEGAA